ncbi:SMI1/KNR4 family protein [Acetobacter sp. P5B1]|uniref:SMI1/KNR4 family protein n=1 Tax=Acetobacter sp. P5B1 TaxID=2762620 RepID=UPI001C04EEDE|nr:SMI1/KNR4 family protein [Acetobacter sp. P5B1]
MFGDSLTGKTELRTLGVNEMGKKIDEIIREINKLDPPQGRKMPLPDDFLIREYEKNIGLKFPNDYKKILKNVSNAFVGYISLLTLNKEMGGIYGELLTTLKEARAQGLPKTWLPICEDNGDYYCILPDGKISFWSHNGVSHETWPNLATWAEEVWLENK